MRQVGLQVMLAEHPQFRGTVSRVEADRFRVTWLKPDNQKVSHRDRIWYPHDTKMIVVASA